MLSTIRGLLPFNLLIAAATAFGCESLTPDNFATAVARSDEDGYTVYWLGEQFEAGGLTFKGPEVSNFGLDVPGGGVEADYVADVAGGGQTNLALYAFSEEGWRLRLAAVGGLIHNGDVSRSVRVAGFEATLVVRPGPPTRDADDLLLAIDVGDTMVLASAGSGGSPAPGEPDYNPLVDEATFLAVMENLRPYPE